MTEIIAKLFDITKLPSKFFAWIAILAGTYAFLPDSALSAHHLNTLPVQYKAYARAAFISSTSFLAINLGLWAWQGVCGWLYRRTAQNMLAESLSQLDFEEVAVIREFYLQRRHVIELPIDHPTVSGLRNKSIIQLAGGTGYRDLAGSVFPVQLNTQARQLRTNNMLRLPENPTAAELERIRNERPNYMSQIQKKDQIRGGKYW